MKLGSTTKKKARLEIIPLIDIMFFLVATFMMVSLSMIKNQGVDVNLPIAYSGKSREVPTSLTVSVTKTGELFCDKEKVTLDVLVKQVKDFQLAHEKGIILLNGDTEAPFGSVLSVLDKLRLLGISNVSIQTQGASTAP